ncbi:ubiquitin-like protein atg8 [Epichloe bromicola]|uniref:Ubiquitin-like protein atg8 n=1 Tax=Epichloe bromicola TaxID=79588 RepID=A0ABQ0CW54_9HYPO
MRFSNILALAMTVVAIKPRAYYQSLLFPLSSGNYVGYTSNNAHTIWTRFGTESCGRVAASVKGDGCITGSSRKIFGHSYCRNCTADRVEKREAEAAAGGQELRDDSECEESVEPNLATIDDKRFFKINYAISEADTKAILDWIDIKNPQYSALPSHLLQHETQFNPHAELHGEKE